MTVAATGEKRRQRDYARNGVEPQHHDLQG